MLNVSYQLRFVGTPRADMAPPEHPQIVRPTERPQSGSKFKEEIFVEEITGGMKQQRRVAPGSGRGTSRSLQQLQEISLCALFSNALSALSPVSISGLYLASWISLIHPKLLFF